MGKIRKFVWEWISEYPIVIFVMFLVTLGHLAIEQVNEHNNEELKEIISHSFFPNTIYIAFLCMCAAEGFHIYRKWKRYPRNAPVKPYVTKFEAGLNSFVKAAFFTMDGISIVIFIISLYPITLDIETEAYKKAMFFHGFFALAIVPFIASVLFTIKKDHDRR
ncbi:MAG TPA: hypothetical protein VNK25_00265 [Candidatus Nitrosotenuis sp.]|jgi:hypothetical protein|nr:hypothetical protein [Candidatus Nitrosotenuis sp.]